MEKTLEKLLEIIQTLMSENKELREENEKLKLYKRISDMGKEWEKKYPPVTVPWADPQPYIEPYRVTWTTDHTCSCTNAECGCMQQQVSMTEQEVATRLSEIMPNFEVEKRPAPSFVLESNTTNDRVKKRLEQMGFKIEA